MNQRIRELAEQAQDWADAHAPYASEEHEYFAEKFAELIVRECCDVLQSEVIQHDGYGYNQFALHNKIKQHFLGSKDAQAQLDEEWYWAIK